MTACPACAGLPPPRAVPVAGPQVLLSLPGIHCAGCIAGVERTLTALPGVASARVNLSLRRVAVETRRPAADLADALTRAGYEAHPLDTAALGLDADPEGRDLALRLGVAGFAMMNVMLLSVAVWSGAAEATRDLFHLISAAISLPAVAFSGQPFFRSAGRALLARRLNMDVPISLAIVLAAGMSLFESLNGGQHAYFDAALSLTFFLLIGRNLDHRTRRAARSAARELTALESQTAERLEAGRTRTVPLTALAVGDEVLIATGTRVPVDGVLTGAAAITDRAFLTGESAPVTHGPGATLQAGEINLGAPFRLRATAVGADTTLRRVADLVARAENARSRYTALADRAARVYAPAVHLLALVAFAGWALATGDLRHALNVAIAVLIITCPCALGLAVPAVSTAAISRLYRMGFLVKSGTALERLAEVQAVFLDKTGTLTLPGAVRTPDLSPKDQAIALGLAQHSAHPVSRALVAALPGTRPAKLDAVEEVPGQGVRGLWQGKTVQLGRGAWIGAPAAGTGLRVGDRLCTLTTGERLRPGTQAALEGLRAAGLRVALISGDRAAPTAQLAQELGIDDWHAAMSAQDKHDLIVTAAEPVAMIGDGLNDTAALAAAHASIAPSSALDAARSAADIVLLRDSLADLPHVFAIARSATRLSRQNFAIATAYNLVAVPVALAGLATPLIAALAMSASSLTVLLNALRVKVSR